MAVQLRITLLRSDNGGTEWLSLHGLLIEYAWRVVNQNKFQIFHENIKIEHFQRYHSLAGWFLHEKRSQLHLAFVVPAHVAECSVWRTKNVISDRIENGGGSKLW